MTFLYGQPWYHWWRIRSPWAFVYRFSHRCPSFRSCRPYHQRPSMCSAPTGLFGSNRLGCRYYSVEGMISYSNFCLRKAYNRRKIDSGCKLVSNQTSSCWAFDWYSWWSWSRDQWDATQFLHPEHNWCPQFLTEGHLQYLDTFLYCRQRYQGSYCHPRQLYLCTTKHWLETSKSFLTSLTWFRTATCLTDRAYKSFERLFFHLFRRVPHDQESLMQYTVSRAQSLYTPFSHP